MKLTDAERELLAPYVTGSYTCTCTGRRCVLVPCDNDREDAFTVVERIVEARIALVRTAMDAARATRPSTSTLQTPEGCEAHGYRRGMAAALDRVGAALRVGDDA